MISKLFRTLNKVICLLFPTLPGEANVVNNPCISNLTAVKEMYRIDTNCFAKRLY